MGIANDVSFVIGAETANAITLNLQLLTINGEDLGSKGVVDMYLSSDALGNTVVNAVGTGILFTAGTDGSVIDNAITGTKASVKMVSEDDGDLDVVLTNSGDETETVYVNVVLANGKVKTSGAVAFIDNP